MKCIFKTCEFSDCRRPQLIQFPLRCAQTARGFTWIELLLVILLLGILTTFIGQLFLVNFQSFETSRIVNERANQWIIGLHRLENEIGWIHSSQIQNFDATHFSFLNKQGLIIAYELNSGQLYRQQSDSSNAFPLINQLNMNNTSSFLYFQSDGISPAVQAKDIQFIKVMFQTTDNQTLTSWIWLRNSS